MQSSLVDIEATAVVQRELAVGNSVQPAAGAQVTAKTEQVNAVEIRDAMSQGFRKAAQYILRPVIVKQFRESRWIRAECADGRAGTTPQCIPDQRGKLRRSSQARHESCFHTCSTMLLRPLQERLGLEEELRYQADLKS